MHTYLGSLLLERAGRLDRQVEEFDFSWVQCSAFVMKRLSCPCVRIYGLFWDHKGRELEACSGACVIVATGTYVVHGLKQ